MATNTAINPAIITRRPKVLDSPVGSVTDPV